MGLLLKPRRSTEAVKNGTGVDDRRWKKKRGKRGRCGVTAAVSCWRIRQTGTGSGSWTRGIVFVLLR